MTRIADFITDRDWLFIPLAVIGGILGLIAVIAVVVALIIGAAKPIMEASCNSAAKQMQVRDGDYRLLTDSCWVTLSNGRKIELDAYRATEDTKR